MRGLVVACALTACVSDPAPPPATQLDEGHTAEALALVGETLYFQSAGDGAIWSLPTDGSAPATKRFDIGLSQFQVDATNLYYVRFNADSSHDLMVQPLAGGAPSALAAGVPYGTLGVNAASAVIVSSSVVRVPLAGGPMQVLGPGANEPSGLALDDTNAYWLAVFGGSCTVQPLDGTMATSFFCMGNHRVAVAGGQLYTSYGCDQLPDCGEVDVTDLATRQMKKLASPSFVSDVVVRDGQLYWREAYQIIRADLDGGHQTVIAQRQGMDELQAMVLGDGVVYWSTYEINGRSAIWVSPR